MPLILKKLLTSLTGHKRVDKMYYKEVRIPYD
jgi:hypothetical protein